MTTWNDIRRDRGANLNRLDYAALELVEADRVYLTETNKTMHEARTSAGRVEARPLSMRKLLRLGLVDPVKTGGRFRLNEDGVAALKAWRDSRANPATEGTKAP